MTSKKRRYTKVSPERAKRNPQIRPADGKPVKVGDVVSRCVTAFVETDSNPENRLAKGVVVYVHPRSRFHVVELCVGGRRFRESYQGVSG